MSEPKPVSWLGRAVEVFLLVAGVAYVVYSAVRLAFYDASAGDTAALTTLGVGLILAGFLRRFESFSALGFQAKLLRVEVEKATLSLDRFRSSSTHMSRVLIRLQSQASNQPGQHPGRMQADAACAQETAALLRSLDVPQQVIAEILEPWVLNTSSRLMELLRIKYQTWWRERDNPIRLRLEQVPPVLNSPASHAYGGASDYWYSGGTWLPPESPFQAVTTLRRWLDAFHGDPELYQYLHADLEAWIARLEHLHRHSELRDPEQWYALEPSLRKA